MIALMKIFNNHPYMFLNFLNRNNAINEVFKTKLSSAAIKDKPYFADVNKMCDYYQQLLDSSTPNIKDKVKDWNSKLYTAITEQRFEDAAKIRDYMIKRKFTIFI